MMKGQQNPRDTIYHLVTESDFQIQGNYYIPVLYEHDGFIHCTAKPDALLAVADDYFSAAEEPVLVLEIDLRRVKAEVKFEPPAPIPGRAVSHLQEGLLFPHIYGPLNLDAVTGVGQLRRLKGQFIWPDDFVSLAEYKNHTAEDMYG